MEKKIPWEKLVMYFAGELNMEEKKKLEIWINNDPERQKLVKFLSKIWKESENLPYRLNEDEAWKTLEREIGRLDKKKEYIDSPAITTNKSAKILSLRQSGEIVQKPGRFGRNIAMIAAVLLIIFTAGIFSHHYYLALQEAEKTVEILKKVLETREGERAIFTLSDGSKIILHAGSKLEVPINFNTNEREVYLEGEAYFDVTYNPDKPFIVRSGESYTRVLGTKFLVLAWPDESRNIEVIVSEGKVALGKNQLEPAISQQEVIINDHQKGIFDSDNNHTVHDISDLHWHLGWTEGRLTFEDRKLSEILPRLELWYAVQIHTESQSISEIKLTAEIDYSQPMMEVLTGIALSLDLEIIKENRTIIFRSADGM